MEPLDDLILGDCPKSGRAMETYDMVLSKPICANCLMFGDSKGHETCHPSLAARQLRTDIDNCNKEGRMKPEWTDNHLKDIRDKQKKSDQLQQSVIDSIERNFSQLVDTLKTRRENLHRELDAEFAKTAHVLTEQEVRWEEKEEIEAFIRQFDCSANDTELLRNAAEIMQGVNNLNEPITTRAIDLITRMDFDIHLSKNEDGNIDFSELVEDLEKYGTIGETKNLHFKS